MDRETLNIVLTSVIVPILVALTGYIVAFLKKKSDELQNKVRNENLRKYIEIAEDAVCKSVEMVSQTFVDALKKEGNFTAEDARLAFEKAKIRVIAILSAEAKETLTAAFGDIDAWLDTQIEYYVRASKVDLEPVVQ